MLHSRASPIAEESVSSGVAENPSNTNLFRAFHKTHRIQGNKAPLDIPVGGEHFWEQSDGHEASKSIIPLKSTSVTKGASNQTFWAN